MIGGRAAAEVGEAATARRSIERRAPWTGRARWHGTRSYGPVDAVRAVLRRGIDADAAAAHAVRAGAVARCLQAPCSRASSPS